MGKLENGLSDNEISIRIQSSKSDDEVLIIIPASVWGMDGLSAAVKNVIDLTFVCMDDDLKIN